VRGRWSADVADRAGEIGRAVRRATPVPFGVRLGVFLAGLVAIVVAYPDWVLFHRTGSLVLLLPVLPALRPRGPLPTLVALAAVFGWLLATTAGARPVRLAPLLLFGAALYLLHSLAALAAVLPYDAVVPLEVVGRWVVRALAVLLGSAVLAILALGATARTGDRAVLVAALVGLAVAAALPTLLAWLWRR